jgi:hypothetical protein
MIWIHPLKKKSRKEVKENPNLLAYGRFQFLVANGRRRRNILFTSSHFPLNFFYLNFFFPIDLKVLLYHGSRPLLTPFLPFFLPINYNHAYWCNKFLAHSLSIGFWLNFFFLSLNSWRCVWPHLTGFKSHKWMKSCIDSHLYIWRWCNILMMKILNFERCILVLKLNPLEFGIIAFLRTLAL